MVIPVFSVLLKDWELLVPIPFIPPLSVIQGFPGTQATHTLEWARSCRETLTSPLRSSKKRRCSENGRGGEMRGWGVGEILKTMRWATTEHFYMPLLALRDVKPIFQSTAISEHQQVDLSCAATWLGALLGAARCPVTAKRFNLALHVKLPVFHVFLESFQNCWLWMHLSAVMSWCIILF